MSDIFFGLINSSEYYTASSRKPNHRFGYECEFAQWLAKYKSGDVREFYHAKQRVGVCISPPKSVF